MKSSSKCSCIYIERGCFNVKVDAAASMCLLCGMTIPKPETIAVWTSLVSINGRLLEDIDNALKKAGLPKLSWYDALLEIEKVGTDGIRPYELRERLLLPQYSLSRLLDRIAQAGLIERQDAKEDGRGQIIRITPDGRAKRHAMWPIYADVLIRSIEQRLTQAETAKLAHLLKKLTLCSSGYRP